MATKQTDENGEIKKSKREEGRQGQKSKGNTIKEKAAEERKSVVRESEIQIDYEESYNVTCE